MVSVELLAVRGIRPKTIRTPNKMLGLLTVIMLACLFCEATRQWWAGWKGRVPLYLLNLSNQCTVCCLGLLWMNYCLVVVRSLHFLEALHNGIQHTNHYDVQTQRFLDVMIGT